MFAVQLGPLALAVGTERATDIRAFVPLQTEPAQDIDDARFGSCDVPIAIGVLDAEDERASLSLTRGLPVRQQPVKKRGAGPANVEEPGRAGGEADTHGRWRVVRFRHV
jgi:hypothetical protein